MPPPIQLYSPNTKWKFRPKIPKRLNLWKNSMCHLLPNYILLIQSGNFRQKCLNSIFPENFHVPPPYLSYSPNTKSKFLTGNFQNSNFLLGEYNETRGSLQNFSNIFKNQNFIKFYIKFYLPVKYLPFPYLPFPYLPVAAIIFLCFFIVFSTVLLNLSILTLLYLSVITRDSSSCSIEDCNELILLYLEYLVYFL